MSPEHPIQENAVSPADATNTYKQNVVAVNNAMKSISASEMPTFPENVPDLDAYTNAYVAARTDANEWLGVLSLLQTVPDEVMNYNDIINDILADAQTQAQALITDPQNASALASLTRDLDNLSSTLKIVTVYITSTITSITNFQSKLSGMATQLTNITMRAFQDAYNYPTDAAALHKLALFFGDLAGPTNAAQPNLQGVLQEWQTLETDVNAAIADINKATTDKTSNNFNAVKADITDAITQWNAAYAQAGSLHLDPQANNASL